MSDQRADLTPRAGRGMTVVYAMEEPPAGWSQAIFAAGPTPRSQDVTSWRPDLLDLLEAAGYDGVVFIPEDRSGLFHGDYDGQVEWEERCLHLADVILFWVPRDLSTMPALTTNVEWGTWAGSGKVVFGAPVDSVKNTYLRHQATQLDVPIAETLAGTVAHALAMIAAAGGGAWRTGGERHVPLAVWSTPTFQSWYTAQVAAGNELRSARVLWTLRAGPHRTVFSWICHVEVWVAAEGRSKSNEVVLSRLDTSAVVLYRRGPSIDTSDVVLVREFRSPATTPDGYVRECPGGSSWDGADPAQTALAEASEEVGLRLEAGRLRPLRSRQVAATLSAHRTHAFAVELTPEELAQLREHAAAGTVFGEAADTERTYVEVRTVAQLREHDLVDWSTLGMILDALT